MPAYVCVFLSEETSRAHITTRPWRSIWTRCNRRPAHTRTDVLAKDEHKCGTQYNLARPGNTESLLKAVRFLQPFQSTLNYQLNSSKCPAHSTDTPLPCLCSPVLSNIARSGREGWVIHMEVHGAKDQCGFSTFTLCFKM